MSKLIIELRNIRDMLHTGICGQRQVWEDQLSDAIAEIERIQGIFAFAEAAGVAERNGLIAEIERLKAESKNYIYLSMTY